VGSDRSDADTDPTVAPDDVRRQWATRTGEFSPEYYAYRGPDEASEAILALLDAHVDRSASVLELGCSSGRHLSYLLEHGYTDLTGVELNADAFEVMADAYPDLAEHGRFHASAIEDVIETFNDDQFDVVYSVETLQHVHPDAAWVFDELVRVTGSLLVTVENEHPSDDQDRRTGASVDASSVRAVTHVDGVPLFHRDWHQVFTERGLIAVSADATRRDTVRAFRPA
jgi:SAM-dependent methyltransferase